MIIKILKNIAFLFIAFTLFLNLINLFFIKNYDYVAYKESATWIFIFIIISLVIVIVEFILAKLKVVSCNIKDWKRLRFSIFVLFLSLFIFAYSPLIATNVFG